MCAELAQDLSPQNKYQMAQLVSFTVNELLPRETDFLSQIADERTVGFGQNAGFEVRIPGIVAVIQAKGATTPRSKVATKQVVVDTIDISARPVINIVEMQDGRVRMSDLVVEATREMANKKILHVQNTLKASITTWGTPFYGTGAGVIAATLDPMVQHWMRTGGVTLLGDIAVVSKLAALTGFTANTTTQQFSNEIINEYNRTGSIGWYKGANVVQIVNPYLADGTTTLLDQDTIYLIPTAADRATRPLKVVTEGNVFSNEETNIDDLSYEIRLDQYFGAAIVMGSYPAMGAYVDSTL